MSDQINPNSRTAFVDSRGHLSKYGQDTILKLYRLLNVSGETSSVDDVLFTNSSTIANNYYNLEPITIAANFTTFGDSFLKVTASNITITLNPTPNDREQVVIFLAGATNVSVTDGTGTDILLNDETVISYRYYVENNQYVRGG